jgi:protein arginine kinase activator
MQCQSCQNNEATIHLTEITDGVRSELHLCESCAVEEGIAVKHPIPLNELLSSLLASQPEDSELFSDPSESQSCPNCGFTLEKFRKEAVLGCPHDYDVFEKALMPLISKAHDGQTQHCGKFPSHIPSDIQAQRQLLDLGRKLDKAVKEENYEQAAQLRDQIKKLEESNKDHETE